MTIKIFCISVLDIDPAFCSFSSDKDKSGNLTVLEFIALPDAEVIEPKDREMDRHWQMEREREFHAVIDANKDGIVSLEELKVRKKFRARNYLPSMKV